MGSLSKVSVVSCVSHHLAVQDESGRSLTVSGVSTLSWADWLDRSPPCAYGCGWLDMAVRGAGTQRGLDGVLRTEAAALCPERQFRGLEQFLCSVAATQRPLSLG